MRSIVTAAAMLLAAASPSFGGGAIPFGPHPLPCRDVEHLADDYVVCSFEPARYRVDLHLRGGNGRPHGSIRALKREIGEVAMAMNAGMYHADLSPVGLYVEHGRETAPLVTSGGWGNFHLLPNGVFLVREDGDGAQRFEVRETLAFAAGRPADVVHATQSGPMLVIDGRLHPRFLPRSDSLKVRNGVGVSGDGTVHFAISRGRVRFHDFGTLFRDVIGARDALFLDGSISTFEAGDRRRGAITRIGPIVTVRERKEARPAGAGRAPASPSGSEGPKAMGE